MRAAVLLLLCWSSVYCESVDDFLEQHFKWRIFTSPESGDYYRLPRTGPARLSTYSVEEFTKMRDISELYLKKAKMLKELETTTTEDKLNLDILMAELQGFVDGFKYEGFLMPITNKASPHKGLKRMTENLSYNKKEDYEDMLLRYIQFPTMMSQQIDLMRQGMAKGKILHDLSVNGIAKEIDGYITNDVEDSPYYQPFVNITDSVDSVTQAKLQSTARSYIKHILEPSMLQLKEFITEEYVTRPEIGISTIPGGQEYYEQCLRFFTTTNMTVEEIHNLGLREAEKIYTAMKHVIASLGRSQTPEEFSKILQDDPAQKFKDGDEVVRDYQELVDNKIYPEIQKIFHNKDIPKSNVIVNADPNPNSPFAYYQSPAIDGSRPGKFSVNVAALDAQSRVEMTALSLHEAIPGHHMQLSYVIEDTTMPMFRRAGTGSWTTMGPSTYPSGTAYIEGWALYSEFLGEEMGLYEDLLQKYGQLSYSGLRAARLVVDTGMHSLGWSRDKAIDFLLKYTALSRENAVGEIDRYITWPGQATAYKVGETRIRQLRSMAAEKLGPLFNIKDFHHVVLKCAGPLTVLENCVDEYVSTTAKGKGLKNKFDRTA